MTSVNKIVVEDYVFEGTADVAPRPFAVAREKTISDRRRIQ